MSRVLPLLLLASTALADDQFPGVLKAFNAARADPFSPGAHARVNPAVEEMVKLMDARVVLPLAEFLVQTIDAEDRIFSEMRTVQQKGATARKRVTEIEAQLRHLDVRLRAGATDVAPRIDALKRELEEMERTFDDVRKRVHQQDRAITYARDLRETLAKGCVTVLKSIDAKAIGGSLVALRRGFDLANGREALQYVHILRDCGRPETSKHLIDVITQPAVKQGPRRQAVSALALLRDRAGVAALLQLWERDPEGAGPYVRHSLSLAAKRPLGDLDAAREWAKTLK